MRSHRGFTLIEVVIALGVVLIIGSFFFQGRTNLMRRPQVDLPTVDWYLLLRELENPDHQFEVTQIDSPQSVCVISYKTKKKYRLLFKDTLGTISLYYDQGRGHITMMNHVKKFYFDRNHVMTITTNRGETYKARLLIPDEGKVTDDSSLGNHLTLSR